MTVTDFLLPVFVQVGLTFVVLLDDGARMRSGSLRRGEIRTEDIALDNRNYTARARQFGNSFSNQFELPMLLFVLIAFILITRVGDRFAADPGLGIRHFADCACLRPHDKQ